MKMRRALVELYVPEDDFATDDVIEDHVKDGLNSGTWSTHIDVLILRSWSVELSQEEWARVTKR